MINLALARSSNGAKVKTVHINEYTGEIVTNVIDEREPSHVAAVAKYLQAHSTFSTYGVAETPNGLVMEYQNISQLTSDDTYGEQYYAESFSFIGFLREMIRIGAKVLTRDGVIVNLNTCRSSIEAFTLSLPYLRNVDGGKAWARHTLLDSDTMGNYSKQSDTIFLVPYGDLGDYDSSITRLGAYVIRNRNRNVEYEQIQFTADLPVVAEKPLAFTAIEVIGAIKLLLDAFELVTPIISSKLFDSTGIIQTPGSGLPPKGHGGIVRISGHRKPNNHLREIFMHELQMQSEHPEIPSTLANDDALYILFKDLVVRSIEAQQNNESLQLYERYKTSYALLDLLLFEIRYNLFTFDQGYLQLLIHKALHETGLSGYKLRFEAGGFGWRPHEF